MPSYSLYLFIWNSSVKSMTVMMSAVNQKNPCFFIHVCSVKEVSEKISQHPRVLGRRENPYICGIFIVQRFLCSTNWSAPRSMEPAKELFFLAWSWISPQKYSLKWWFQLYIPMLERIKESHWPNPSLPQIFTINPFKRMYLLFGLSPFPGCQWQMKVLVGIPEPKSGESQGLLYYYTKTPA